MLLNVFIKSPSESSLSSQDDVTLLLVDRQGTPAEHIVESKMFSFKDPALYSHIKHLVEVHKETTGSELNVRCILRETDIITCTTNKVGQKKIFKLLKNKVSKANHGLVLDFIYYLADCDYYIFSLVDDRLYKKVKLIQGEVGGAVEAMTENQLILTVLLKRGRSQQSTDDCIVLNNKFSHYVCYAATESGIPYRILNLNSDADVMELSSATDIKKCMFIDCADKTFKFDVSIALIAGTIKASRLALICQPALVQQVKCDEKAEDILLEKNSLEYKKFRRHGVLSFIVKLLCAVLVVAGVATASLFWLSKEKNLEFASEIGMRIASAVGNVPFTEREDYKFKLGHDRVVYLLRQGNVGYSKVEMVEVDASAQVYVYLDTGTVTGELLETLKATDAEGFEADTLIDDKTGNIILVFTIQSGENKSEHVK